MPILDYMRAAPLPHLTTLKTIAVGLGANAWVAEVCGGAGRLLLVAAVGWITVLCQADALCRYYEYRRVREMLARHGFRPRILKPMLASRCQRDAALLAARKTGHLAATKAVMRARGYRAYHLVPDAIRKAPATLLCPTFWRATLLPRRPKRSSIKKGPHGTGHEGAASV